MTDSDLLHARSINRMNSDRQVGRRGRRFRACRTFAFATLLAAGPGISANAQGGDFHDDFEAAALAPFWTSFELSGNVTFPSVANVHSGAQSLQFDSSDTGSNKDVGVHHVFATPTYGTVSVWMFDSGADEPSSNYLTLNAPPFAVSTWDYDLGPGTGDTYTITAGSDYDETSIDRTKDWHHFVITSLPNSSTVEIDGSIVYTGPGGQPFLEVQLDMHAPWYRPAWTSYWDDFDFVEAKLASWANYGSGFAGTGGVPSFTARAAPVLGTDVILDLENSSGQATICCLVLGLGEARLPTGKGGDLLVDPALFAFVVLPASGVALEGTVPADDTLTGFELDLQALELDPGAARGVAFTPGLKLILGY